MVHQSRKVQLTRRTALRNGIASAVVAAIGPAQRRAWASIPMASTGELEPEAGSWVTWVLQSGSELRPPAPPNPAATRSEIEALQMFAADRVAHALDQVSYWDTGAPGYRWNEIAIAQGLKMGSVSPPTACWRW